MQIIFSLLFPDSKLCESKALQTRGIYYNKEWFTALNSSDSFLIWFSAEYSSPVPMCINLTVVMLRLSKKTIWILTQPDLETQRQLSTTAHSRFHILKAHREPISLLVLSFMCCLHVSSRRSAQKMKWKSCQSHFSSNGNTMLSAVCNRYASAVIHFLVVTLWL